MLSPRCAGFLHISAQHVLRSHCSKEVFGKSCSSSSLLHRSKRKGSHCFTVAEGKQSVLLSLAWAMTIHKCQGLTLNKATVHLGDTEQSLGMSFVAMSRVRTSSDLLLAPFPFDRLQSLGASRSMQARKNEESRLQSLTI